MDTVSNREMNWQVRRIPLDEIEVDPAVQQRAAGTSRSVVHDYAEAMRNGTAFPPIDVFTNGDGPYYLGDGVHRRMAHLLAHPDVKDIECKVHRGDRDDALLFACGANAQHGLRRSRADKVKAVTTLITSKRWSGLTDREIARRCEVSHPFVAAVRRKHVETFPDADSEQAAAAETPPAPDKAEPVRRRTVKRRGRRSKLNTARIGRNRPQRRDEAGKLKRAFERFQRELSEASEPARRKFVEDCREEIMALASTPEAPIPEPANPEPPNPEPPSPAEVESATVPPRPQGMESAKCPG